MVWLCYLYFGQFFLESEQENTGIFSAKKRSQNPEGSSCPAVFVLGFLYLEVPASFAATWWSEMPVALEIMLRLQRVFVLFFFV